MIGKFHATSHLSSMATRVHRQNPQHLLENRKCECEHHAQRQETLLTIPLTIFYCKAVGLTIKDALWCLVSQTSGKNSQKGNKTWLHENKQTKKTREKCGRNFKIFVSCTVLLCARYLLLKEFGMNMKLTASV